MIAGTLYNQLITTLKGAPALTYMEAVFQGFVFNIEPETTPFIAAEIVSNNEIMQDLNQFKKIFFGVDIYAFTHVPNDSDLTITGGRGYKGMLDIENDIRGVLTSSNTLGDRAIDIQFDPTIFDVEQTTKTYSVRGLRMPIRILYQQKDGA